MRIEEQIDAMFLKFPSVQKDFKLEWDAHRYLLCGKMFAMRGYNKEETKILTVKLPPQEGAYYRENYDFVIEGYYMNKVHWISIFYEQCEQSFIEDIIEKAYDAFLHTLPKKLQQEIIP